LDVRYSVSFNGCKMTLTANDYTRLGQRARSPLDSVISFNLSEIDPTTIKADESDYRLGVSPSVNVVFDTTDDENRITVYYPNDIGASGKTESVHRCCGILLNDGLAVAPEYAPHLTRALINAVRMCGGKASAF